MLGSILLCALCLWIPSALITATEVPCALRDLGDDNRVCVCNSTYCDTVQSSQSISDGYYSMITSNKAGQRLNMTTGKLSKSPLDSTQTCFLLFKCPSVVKFVVNTSSEGQEIVGFGGAFTDAAGINILSLSEATQDNFLRSYFSKDGIEYNMGRVPIGGTDFSTRKYSLDDNNNVADPQLANFSLTVEDYVYKIPMIKRAEEIRGKKLKLMCAPWSPPVWMKTNNDFSGWGYLKDEYYATYVKYLLRFLDDYEKNGIKFWAISTQNEPINGNIFFININSLGWLPASLGNWIENFFGPMIRNSTHRDIQIYTLDDQRSTEFLWIDLLINEHPKSIDYVSGWGLHWYWDKMVSASILNNLHNKFPNKHILYTEASSGFIPYINNRVKLGSWGRGVDYISNIIENVNHWAIGWIDWNLCLNEKGGPAWTGGAVDSAIIVNATADEFYKQPMFYAMAHVSKYVQPGAVRLFVDQWSNSNVQLMALRNPDSTYVIVVVNKNDEDKETSIRIKEEWINVKLPKNSFVTILLKSK